MTRGKIIGLENGARIFACFICLRGLRYVRAVAAPLGLFFQLCRWKCRVDLSEVQTPCLNNCPHERGMYMIYLRPTRSIPVVACVGFGFSFFLAENMMMVARSESSFHLLVGALLCGIKSCRPIFIMNNVRFERERKAY